MTHNDIIAKLKQKAPGGAFFHYFAKSRYSAHPFDVMLVYDGTNHYIEVKKDRDKLKPHQKAALELIQNNGSNSTKCWVIRGAISRKKELIRDYIRLESVQGEVIGDGSYNEIMDFLTGKHEG
jgi:hypothetical protein